MNLKIGELVTTKIENLLNVEIVDKQIDTYDELNSKYNFILTNSKSLATSASNLILQYQGENLFKEVYTGTIINYYDGNDEQFHTTSVNDFRDKYTYYYENPLFIKSYECISNKQLNNSYGCEFIADDVEKVSSFAVEKLDSKYQEILKDDQSYKKDVKTKIKVLI